MSLDQEVYVVAWVKKGLQFFHDMSYHGALGVKTEMIVEVHDGYNILYKKRQSQLFKSLK